MAEPRIVKVIPRAQYDAYARSMRLSGVESMVLMGSSLSGTRCAYQPSEIAGMIGEEELEAITHHILNSGLGIYADDDPAVLALMAEPKKVAKAPSADAVSPSVARPAIQRTSSQTEPQPTSERKDPSPQGHTTRPTAAPEQKPRVATPSA